MTEIKAFGDKVLAIMVDNPSGFKKTKSGIILKDEDMTASAVRPRWFKIYSTGEKIDWVVEGQYVLVAHGRWSNGVKVNDDLKIYLLDNEEMLMVSDTKPEGVTFEEDIA
jgi:co-chaperonin GroES (HSP10)